MPEIVPAPGVLVRLRDAPEGKSGTPRNPAEEASTLAWHHAAVAADVDRVLLVDDVLRTGATLEAGIRAMPSRLMKGTAGLAIFEAYPPEVPT